VLRHKPETIGITLDPAGWVSIPVLLKAMAAHGRSIKRADLEQLVAEDAKTRYSIDGNRIRANQGHSVAVDLGLEPVTPPEVLYHGTVGKFVRSISTEGINKGSRQHVHLSGDIATAKTVGGRRGVPVVLTIDTARMLADGHKFYLSANEVWLTDHVPPQYITYPPKEHDGNSASQPSKSTSPRTTRKD
jgi:putative RNA 2'-phosphotransferase